MPQSLTYEGEMSAGEADLERDDLTAARLHFGRAHGLGHDVRCRHVMAHRQLMQVGWRAGRTMDMLNHAWRIATVDLFDRPTAQG